MIHVVIGHICSGKSWFVRENAGPEDVVVDMDRLALALSAEGTPHHEYPDHVVDVARFARWAAIDEAVRRHARGRFDVWIIHAYPSDVELARYRRLGAAVREMRVDHATLVERAARERPERMRRLLGHRLAAEPCQIGGSPTGVGSTDSLPICP
jgi:hypothetical protein